MKLALLACGTLLAGGVAVATRYEAVDVNKTTFGPQLTTEQVQTLVRTEVDKAGIRPLAVAVIPGAYGSYDIDLYVLNLFSGAAITDVTFDPFKALNGRSLLVEDCWSMTPDVILEYPVAFGRGPMVLNFDRFGLWQARAVGMDPDTYENPSFGATVLEMTGTRVEVVFGNGTRGEGILHATDFGVAAFIFPTYLPVTDRFVRDGAL